MIHDKLSKSAGCFGSFTSSSCTVNAGLFKFFANLCVFPCVRVAAVHCGCAEIFRITDSRHVRALSGLLLDRSILRFLATGVLNTVVGLGVIYLMMWMFGMPERPANLIGYGVGVVVSYQVNSRWTFGYRDALLPVLPRYAAVILLAYLTNLACLHVLLLWQVNGYLAQALALPPYTATGFVGMRYWVFNNRRSN